MCRNPCTRRKWRVCFDGLNFFLLGTLPFPFYLLTHFAVIVIISPFCPALSVMFLLADLLIFRQFHPTGVAAIGVWQALTFYFFFFSCYTHFFFSYRSEQMRPR
uniref:Uncharacterized protein n=1 Tax=Trypanosoma congolense (strain IL3000) TaxID=1068625 RepID=G0UKY1_TRYCI|nr:hypothetical protein, unlikely [Trypanosoma congolense IL3000]